MHALIFVKGSAPLRSTWNSHEVHHVRNAIALYLFFAPVAECHLLGSAVRHWLPHSFKWEPKKVIDLRLGQSLFHVKQN